MILKALRVLMSVLPLCFTIPAAAKADTARIVTANYRPNFGAYGNNVAGYKREIQQAQTAGVDAFALDMEGWGPDTAKWASFQQEAGYLFQAATGTSFKLFFDLDCHGYGFDSECQNAAGQMMAAYANHPNYLQYQGRPVFTGWDSGYNSTPGSASESFWSGVVSAITARNIKPFFIPTFSNWTVSNPPSTAQSIARTDAWFSSGWLAGAANGLMTWGALVPPLIIENNRAFAGVAAKHGLTFASVVEAWHAPIRYLSEGQVVSGSDMASLEFNGGEGLSNIWQDIINNTKPPIVYVATWNDYTESYVGPATQADLIANNLSAWQAKGDYLYTHAAYTDLNRYFAQWYKSGTQPTWPDALYVFYRTAPMSARATSAPAGTTISWNQQGINPTLDDIYVTTILTAPATLTISTGNKVTNIRVPAGLNHTRVPFAVGAQKVTLTRQRVVASITGRKIVSSQPYYYNVNPASYYAYGQ